MNTRLAAGILCAAALSLANASTPALCHAKTKTKTPGMSKPVDTTPATVKMWEDRGDLTPTKVFWGVASAKSDPTKRLPKAPFSNFVKDTKFNAYSPKCDVTDSAGVTWTVKFGEEVHPDVAAGRLAWALGYAADENYYVASGQIQGVTSSTDLGKARGHVHSDGMFQNARFKRHPEHHLKDASGNPIFWDESKNPGVSSEQLSGLKILDVMVFNWDAQPKNCEILRVKGDAGPENWYMMGDWGESFGNRKSAWKLSNYQNEPFITAVSGDSVKFHFSDAKPSQTKAHTHIPLRDAQWFRKQLDKLTDDEIRAAFNASVADDAMIKAYQSGDMDQVNRLTTPEVNGFVAAFRRRIQEFDAKVPAGS